MAKEAAIVVIPIYTYDINEFEKVSLRRCMEVLGSHPVAFIAPESMDTSEYEKTYGISRVERFADEFFFSVYGYNKLMLSTEFYERFEDYEYILLCQTDAYVFSDRLLEWCGKGYDYIGAPWIPKAKYNAKCRRVELGVNQFFNRYFGLKSSRAHYFYTGNGGLSLRKTETFIRITNEDKHRIEKFLSVNSPSHAEDVYWSLVVNKWRKRISIPSYREAMGFAFENYPELLYEYNGGLPFGAHAWYKGQKERLEFWRKYIALPKEKEMI